MHFLKLYEQNNSILHPLSIVLIGLEADSCYER